MRSTECHSNVYFFCNYPGNVIALYWLLLLCALGLLFGALLKSWWSKHVDFCNDGPFKDLAFITKLLKKCDMSELSGSIAAEETQSGANCSCSWLVSSVSCAASNPDWNGTQCIDVFNTMPNLLLLHKCFRPKFPHIAPLLFPSVFFKLSLGMPGLNLFFEIPQSPFSQNNTCLPCIT